MKSNYLFMVVLITILLLAGCANKNVSLEEETGSDFVPTMTLQIIKNGVEMAFERKAHKWEEKLSSEESRTTFIEYAPPTITVNANQKVKLMIENNPKLSVYSVEENERVEEISLEKNELSTPGEKGHYIYQVFAEWPNGKATYLLNLEVQ